MLRKISKNELNQIFKDLKIYGFSHVKSLILNQKVKVLLNKVIKIHKDLNLKTTQIKGLPKRDSKDLRIYNLPEKDKYFIDLITDIQIEKILKPLINDPYYRFLPRNVPNYIVGSSTARSSGYALDLHIDSMFPFSGKWPISILLLFVLEEMNEKNGATIVVPGSHMSSSYTDRSLKDRKVICAKPGDLVLIDSRTWHGTLENKTNKTRWLINSLITQWWLKQQVDIPDTIPKSIFKKLSNKQKQILGYCSIPPKSELDRINTKCGYDILKNFKGN